MRIYGRYGYEIFRNCFEICAFFINPERFCTTDPVDRSPPGICLFRDEILISPVAGFGDLYPFDLRYFHIGNINVEYLILTYEFMQSFFQHPVQLWRCSER